MVHGNYTPIPLARDLLQGRAMQTFGRTRVALMFICSSGCVANEPDPEPQAMETDAADDSGGETGQNTGTGPSDPMTTSAEGSTAGGAAEEGSTGSCEYTAGRIGPDTLPTFVAGQPIEIAFTIDGEEAVSYVDWYLLEAPETLEIDDIGVLTGTVAEAGTYPLEIRAQLTDPGDYFCDNVPSKGEYELEIVAPD
jgi:hypothetical protein